MRSRLVSLSIAVSVASVFTLTSCSSSESVDNCEPVFQPGALSESVTVQNNSGAVDFHVGSGFNILNPQLSFVESAGNASQQELITIGDIVAANVAYIAASTGEVLQVSPTFGTNAADSFFLASEDTGAIVASVLCSRPGETVVLALPEDAAAEIGIAESDAVVAIEIIDAFSSHATGSSHQLPNGFPAVAVDNTGRPGIVLPPLAPPSTLTSAVHITGTGDVVQPEDQVIGQVLEVSWLGSVQRNSWETGPMNFGTEADIAQTMATFRSALTGVPVGSQVVVIEPDQESARVSVIDILAVA